MPARKSNKPALPPLTLLGLVVFSIVVIWLFSPSKSSTQQPVTPDTSATKEYIDEPVALPSPVKTSRVSLEQTLNTRRSRRSFQDKPLTLNQVSQLLWSAQGVTTDWGGRTAPSAKSAYPLTLYLVALDVTGLEPGIYEYIPGDLDPVHQLRLLQSGDFSEQMALAGVQSQFKSAPAVIAITGNFQKMKDAFDGKDVSHNVYLEAGHVGQNLYLQAESLGLGTVATGGFDKAKSTSLLKLPTSETLIYLMPFGFSAE